jgi:DNA primase
MRITRSFIDELVARVDLVDLIDSYIKLRKAGRNFTACCPFHQEKTPSFSVSPEKQFYYCFGCGAHGTAISFLMEYARLGYVEAIHELASRMGMQVVYEQGAMPDESFSEQQELYEIMAQAAQYYWQQWHHPHAQAAKEYFNRRGLSGRTARDFGIGYALPGWDNLLKALATNSDQQTRLLKKVGLIKQNEAGRYYDHFRDRVMFPIHDRRGRVIAFGGRLLTDKDNEPKYLNSPETPLFKKGSELYGWYFARKVRPLEQIIVVEGYMDVIMLAQYGIHNVVATLGTATTPEHLTRLFRDVPDLIFCFDGDDAGRKAAWRALENVLPLLQDGRQVRFVFLPQGEDPDTLVRKAGAAGFNHYLSQAIPLSSYLFETLTPQVNLNTTEGQAKLKELATPLLTQLPTSSYRNLMFQKLSELTRINQQELTRLIPNNPIYQPTVVKKPKPPRSFRELSLVRQAIVFLLHKPTLSQLIDNSLNEKLKLVSQLDIPLLLELIELSRKQPHLTLGALCEHWQGTGNESTINELAKNQLIINELAITPDTTGADIDIEKEFTGAIQRLIEEINKENEIKEFFLVAQHRIDSLKKGSS